MAKVNLQVLRSDHSLHLNCVPPFWAIAYERDGVLSSSPGQAAITVYCIEHERVETFGHCYTGLLMRLACGFLSLDDWVLVMSRWGDPVNEKDLICHDLNGKL